MMRGFVRVSLAASLSAASLAFAAHAAAECATGQSFYDDVLGVHYRCLNGSFEAVGDMRGTVPSTQAAPADPVPGQTIPGEGTFLVGVDIASGTYKSGPSSDLPCQWWTQGELGNDESQTGFDSSDGQTYAVIRTSDESFHTQFCQTWIKVR